MPPHPRRRRPAVGVVPPAGCLPATGHGSIATTWEETAADALRTGAASEPAQARDLFDVSLAMWKAWAAAPKSAPPATPRSATPPTACSSGKRPSARTSSRTFALLTESCVRSATRPSSPPRMEGRRRRSETGSPQPRSPPADTTARTNRCTTSTRATCSQNRPLDRRARRLDRGRPTFWPPLALGNDRSRTGSRRCPRRSRARRLGVGARARASRSRLGSAGCRSTRAATVRRPFGRAYKREALAVLNERPRRQGPCSPDARR